MANKVTLAPLFYNADGICIPRVQLWMQSFVWHICLLFSQLQLHFYFPAGCCCYCGGSFGAKIIAKPICGNYLMCTPRWARTGLGSETGIQVSGLGLEIGWGPLTL